MVGQATRSLVRAFQLLWRSFRLQGDPGLGNWRLAGRYGSSVRQDGRGGGFECLCFGFQISREFEEPLNSQIVSQTTGNQPRGSRAFTQPIEFSRHPDLSAPAAGVAGMRLCCERVNPLRETAQGSLRLPVVGPSVGDQWKTTTSARQQTGTLTIEKERKKPSGWPAWRRTRPHAKASDWWRAVGGIWHGKQNLR